jgi:hypothetical protein
VAQRRRPEERVDGGAVAVLDRPRGQAQVPVHHQHVMVGRGDVHDAVAQRGRLLGGNCGQRAGPVQDPGQGAGRAAGDVQHHDHSGREVMREARRHCAQRLDPTRGRPDHDQPPAHAG